MSLPARLLEVEGVEESPSMFGDKPALWVNGREIAHADAPGVYDVRLTRRVVSELRPRLKADPRVQLRPSTSDWVSVTVAGEKDDDLLAELVERAAAAHRPSPGRTSAPPPAGADLERRRHFH
jgi:hypothetical protein